jgi:Flp pilus assembly protein TadB
MIILGKVSLLLLLFLLLFISFRYLFITAGIRRRARFRLQYIRQKGLSNRIVRWMSRNRSLYAHISELLESLQVPFGVGHFMLASFILVLFGISLGFFFFQSMKGVLFSTGICAVTPYLMLRMKLINLRLTTRLEFLPAVEIFYQYYVLCGQKNIKTAMQACLDENRMTMIMRPVFSLLCRNLLMGRDTEQSLKLFAMALGHRWSDYFVNIVRVAVTEGNNVSESLQSLIADMRKARRADQAERNRLLEIRIANFTPILFLALFLGINFKMNPHNAYHYYVLDPAGRNMLLDALLLIFASFIMGIYLSMKRM